MNVELCEDNSGSAPTIPIPTRDCNLQLLYEFKSDNLPFSNFIKITKLQFIHICSMNLTTLSTTRLLTPTYFRTSVKPTFNFDFYIKFVL